MNAPHSNIVGHVDKRIEQDDIIYTWPSLRLPGHTLVKIQGLGQICSCGLTNIRSAEIDEL